MAKLTSQERNRLPGKTLLWARGTIRFQMQVTVVTRLPASVNSARLKKRQKSGARSMPSSQPLAAARNIQRSTVSEGGNRGHSCFDSVGAVADWSLSGVAA